MKTTENSPGANDLRTVLLTGLKDILWAENALVKALPKMMDKSTDVRLKTAIYDHHTQTQNHVERLKLIFELLGETPEATTCLAMQGILKEGDDLHLPGMPMPCTSLQKLTSIASRWQARQMERISLGKPYPLSTYLLPA